MMKTEELDLEFTDDAVEKIAEYTTDINKNIENIGARRLQTIMERILDDISFEASDKSGEKITVDADFVAEHIGDLAQNTDLSGFIL